MEDPLKTPLVGQLDMAGAPRSPDNPRGHTPPTGKGDFRKVVAICNAKSGERAAFSYLYDRLVRELGPDKVVNLIARKGVDNPAQHSPNGALEMIKREKLGGDDVVIVAGGDGTVAWAMNIVEEACALHIGVKVRLRRASKLAELQVQEGLLATVVDTSVTTCSCTFDGREPVQLASRDLEPVPFKDDFARRPFVAIVPLGTGNDLSRALGFGPGFVQPGSCQSGGIARVLGPIRDAYRSVLDRWKVEVWARNPGTGGEPLVVAGDASLATDIDVHAGPLGLAVTRVAEGSAAARNGIAVHSEIRTVGGQPVHTPEDFHSQVRSMVLAREPPRVLIDQYVKQELAHSALCNNYVSFGFDAVIAERFDTFRKQFGWLCRTRHGNKVWYGVLGFSALFGSPRVSQFVRLHYRACPGDPLQEVDLTGLDLRSLIMSNLDSFAAGMNPWGKGGCEKLHDGQEAVPQVPFDHRIEVCGFRSSSHMGLAKVGCLRPVRLCQAYEIVWEVDRFSCPQAGMSGLRMQVDGEAIRLPPDGCRVRVSFLKTSRVLATRREAVAPEEKVVNATVGIDIVEGDFNLSAPLEGSTYQNYTPFGNVTSPDHGGRPAPRPASRQSPVDDSSEPKLLAAAT